MSGNDLVRVWKDPDERGDDSAHPAGEITLDDLSGAGDGGLPRPLWTFIALCDSFGYECPPRSVCFAVCPWD